eukprot:TRINITY_DN6895_c0_g1_i1.p1 TRINITY_DN6895_c0_g1~~TRINITY_DN6895_c0_g1_i1.p1  ORF type:complete len:357 (-),score=56.58 TRINITY_DN6895_c0_g1_i1:79-1149(-)
MAEELVDVALPLEAEEEMVDSYQSVIRRKVSRPKHNLKELKDLMAMVGDGPFEKEHEDSPFYSPVYKLEPNLNGLEAYMHDSTDESDSDSEKEDESFFEELASDHSEKSKLSAEDPHATSPLKVSESSVSLSYSVFSEDLLMQFSPPEISKDGPGPSTIGNWKKKSQQETADAVLGLIKQSTAKKKIAKQLLMSDTQRIIQGKFQVHCAMMVSDEPYFPGNTIDINILIEMTHVEHIKRNTLKSRLPKRPSRLSLRNAKHHHVKYIKILLITPGKSNDAKKVKTLKGKEVLHKQRLKIDEHIIPGEPWYKTASLKIPAGLPVHKDAKYILMVKLAPIKVRGVLSPVIIVKREAAQI